MTSRRMTPEESRQADLEYRRAVLRVLLPWPFRLLIPEPEPERELEL